MLRGFWTNFSFKFEIWENWMLTYTDLNTKGNVYFYIRYSGSGIASMGQGTTECPDRTKKAKNLEKVEKFGLKFGEKNQVKTGTKGPKLGREKIQEGSFLWCSQDLPGWENSEENMKTNERKYGNWKLKEIFILFPTHQWEAAYGPGSFTWFDWHPSFATVLRELRMIENKCSS